MERRCSISPDRTSFAGLGRIYTQFGADGSAASAASGAPRDAATFLPVGGGQEPVMGTAADPSSRLAAHDGAAVADTPGPQPQKGAQPHPGPHSIRSQIDPDEPRCDGCGLVALWLIGRLCPLCADGGARE